MKLYDIEIRIEKNLIVLTQGEGMETQEIMLSTDQVELVAKLMSQLASESKKSCATTA